MQSDEFNIETALEAAKVLEEVLAARIHRKKVWGQEVIVPGKLGEALKLPSIISELSGKMVKRRERGLDRFQELWETLSENTRSDVLNRIGWYDPKTLSWEDKRSNRRPVVTKSKES